MTGAMQNLRFELRSAFSMWFSSSIGDFSYAESWVQADMVTFSIGFSNDIDDQRYEESSILVETLNFDALL